MKQAVSLLLFLMWILTAAACARQEGPAQEPGKSSPPSSTASGGELEPLSGGSEPLPSIPMSEAEYTEAAPEIINQINKNVSEILSQTQELAEGGMTDELREQFKTIRALCDEMISIEAPGKYAAAQEKFKSGCQALIRYMDGASQLIQAEAGDKDRAAGEFQRDGAALLGRYSSDITDGTALFAKESGTRTEE